MGMQGFDSGNPIPDTPGRLILDTRCAPAYSGTLGGMPVHKKETMYTRYYVFPYRFSYSYGEADRLAAVRG